MKTGNNIRLESDQLLFKAAANDGTLVGGMTLLRLMPAGFGTTLRFVKNTRGDDLLSMDAAPFEAKDRMLSYWADHLQVPMTDRLQFVLEDIVELGRLSADAERASVLRFSFHNVADKILPFMPHAGLRLIYDAQSDETDWAIAELRSDIQPKLGDLALFVDVVPIEMRSDRPQTEDRREAFLASLEQYKRNLAKRRYPGASEISPELIARMIDVNPSLLKLDVPEPEGETQIPLSTQLYSMWGGGGEDEDEEEEGAEGGELAHDAEHAVGAAAVAHMAEAHAAEAHAPGAAHEDPVHIAQEQAREQAIEQARYLGELAHGRIHQFGNKRLDPQTIADAMKAIGMLNAVGLGSMALSIGSLLGEHQHEATEYEELDKLAEEKQQEAENEIKIRANENEEFLRERGDEWREERQMGQDEWDEEMAVAAGLDPESMHESHLTAEEENRDRDEAAERTERLQDESGEDLTSQAREGQDELLLHATGLRESQELEDKDIDAVEEQGARDEREESPEAAGETAAGMGESGLEAQGDGGETGDETQGEPGEKGLEAGDEIAEAAGEAGGEAAAEDADEGAAKLEETMRERLMEEDNISLERQQEEMALNNEERVEGAKRLSDDIDEIQGEAAENRELKARSVEQAEKEKDRVERSEHSDEDQPHHEDDENDNENRQEESEEDGEPENRQEASERPESPEGERTQREGQSEREDGSEDNQQDQDNNTQGGIEHLGHVAHDEALAHEGAAHGHVSGAAHVDPSHAAATPHDAHTIDAVHHMADAVHHTAVESHSLHQNTGEGALPQGSHHEAGRYDTLHAAAQPEHIHAASTQHSAAAAPHAGMESGAAPAHSTGGRYDTLHEAASAPAPGAHGGAAQGTHFAHPHETGASGALPSHAHAAMHGAHKVGATHAASGTDDTMHMLHHLDAIHGFQHAASATHMPVGHWPSGRTPFSPTHFGMMPGASFAKTLKGNLIRWGGAIHPKLDPIDHMTRSILANHAVMPRKQAVMKPPNFGHSFTDFAPGPAFNPAPAPEDS